MNLNPTKTDEIFKERLAKHIQKHNPEQKWILDNLLFAHIGGSHLYGINRPESDHDIRGVVLAPKSYWVGARGFEQLEAKWPEFNSEVVIYDFRKWLKLTSAVNPNVVETLFVEPNTDNVTHSTKEWEQLRLAVWPLISKQAYSGFHGYSSSQLKKMVVKQSNKTGRQEITKEHGFDLKFASHGFRLIRQGVELLETGRLTFPRPDREDLLSIRKGQKYGPNDMQKCIDDWQQESADLAQAYVNSKLPEKADFDTYNYILENTFDKVVNGI